MKHAIFTDGLPVDAAASVKPAVMAYAIAAPRPMASRRLHRLSLPMDRTLAGGRQRRFVYNQTMHVVRHADAAASSIAAAIGEPARARMLFCLLDGRARTSTELAAVAS